MEKLRQLLKSVDKKSYKAYKDLKGSYSFTDYTLTVDHVQGDPFAKPSRLSILVPLDRAAFPPELWDTRIRRIACEDFIGRAVASAIDTVVKGRRGSGKSGEMAIATSGQQVLVRNAVLFSPESVEVRITVGLPADGRTILGADAETIFFKELPAVVKQALYYRNLSATRLGAHVAFIEDQDYLRGWLAQRNLVAFVAEGAVLPRRSGIDDRPLIDGAIPFQSPPSLSITAELPNAGPVSGLGIPRGVTLVVGGGFHGKSTLLHAIERGVYNHIPGDGRERVATDASSVKIRAEDGRSISRVNISPFIDRLPFGRDTRCFSTENASGSTSQAANIVEAIETGTRVLLIDEDTSATNFMIRDERMQRLVAAEKEPITPFLHRVRELYLKQDISTVIVMGGSGDYFEVADTVIMMDNYQPKDVTGKARQLAGKSLASIELASMPALKKDPSRRPGRRTLDASRGKYPFRIDAQGVHALSYGEKLIDLRNVEQLVDKGQTQTIGWMLYYFMTHYTGNRKSLVDNLWELFQVAEECGLDVFSPYKVGDLALPRLQEVAAAINRIRSQNWEQ